jgi:hypothetical protein
MNEIRVGTPHTLRVAAIVVGTICGLITVAGQGGQAGPPVRPPVASRDSTLPLTPPTGTAVIAGTLVSATSGSPVRRASVELTSLTPGPTHSAMTDDQGQFLFKDLPAGQFTLTASKPGYLDATYGQKHVGSGRPGTPIPLKDGQRLEHLSLAIPRGGVMTGTIVDDAGEPAFGTTVRALRYVMRSGERTLQPAGSALADDRGIYRISALPPGDYILNATPRDDARPDALKVAAEKMMADGSTVGASFFAQSSDPLLMRIGGGAADAESSPRSGYAPVYYPNTTSAGGASAITLDVGEERTSLDLQLPLVPMGRVAGVVTGGDATSVMGVTVQLIDNGQSLPGMGTRMTRPGPDGRFVFPDVPPGQYTVTARSGALVSYSVDSSGGQVRMMFSSVVKKSGPAADAGSGGPVALWAATDVAVDGPGTPIVTLALQPGMTVSGKIAFDGSLQPPTDLTQIRLVLGPASPGDGRAAVALGQVDADGRFKFSDVVPGSYRLTAPAPRGWRPKSVDVGGRDALDFPLEVRPNEDITGAVVTFTDRGTDLSGTLQDPTGQPTSDWTIVVFAADPRYWTPQSRRIQATRPATDGRFSLQNLPPGDYGLVAVNDPEPGQWYDPAFLQQLSGAAMRLTLGDGEKKVQDVRVVR